ncbi:Aminoacyl-tRNA synthetase, class II (D/K/N)-like domain-containing protein [Rozella allomycis CSF55]|uniref:asparagine--tRNA ligase n=1 Tax=Rozella allomycis (strain CSF55) TaxID=988480 RepID=A0A075AN32_ROZAC|nr:Aminoacyl-tRNA synthetase, class II (D/K/N)-like domain-containing protein [Rozella allomycis CSF55]|eukprot:EPZ31123.1 Aminoacyl-tRNA synthetase, class II (D/K/N)-like domain-containing protein [Rozella allomycis CSF55]
MNNAGLFKNNIKKILQKPLFGSEYILNGWAKQVRKQKTNLFFQLSDGSNLHGLSCLTKPTNQITNGCSMLVKGNLQSHPTLGTPELLVNEFSILGNSDETYPIQKRRMTIDELRNSLVHFKPRTSIGLAYTKLNHHLTKSIHDAFAKLDFTQIYTPLITSMDCEGAGETFSLGSQLNCNANLTVSGQLHLEIFANCMAKVYTFGSTFRAEKSHTNRHLAEFRMVEGEMAFLDDVGELMDYIEFIVRESVNDVFGKCSDELKVLHEFNRAESGLDHLMKNFHRISYKEAIKILQKEYRDIEFGSDLSREHELYLTNVHFNHSPVFVYNYPKSLKPFYMRQVDDDSSLVSCCDLLVPHVGEIVGGSLREERYSNLLANIHEKGMDPKKLDWYLDLRKYGTTRHGGFGLGYERLLQWISASQNIKDCVFFPRSNGHCPI